jgi:hypothetical protein
VTEVVTPMGVGAQRDVFLVASAVVLADTHTPTYISTASLAFDPRVTPYPGEQCDHDRQPALVPCPHQLISHSIHVSGNPSAGSARLAFEGPSLRFQTDPFVALSSCSDGCHPHSASHSLFSIVSGDSKLLLSTKRISPPVVMTRLILRLALVDRI